jgi:hypothetical protein
MKFVISGGVTHKEEDDTSFIHKHAKSSDIKNEKLN